MTNKKENEMAKVVLHLLENYFDSIYFEDTKNYSPRLPMNNNYPIMRFNLKSLKNVDENGRIVVDDKVLLQSIIVFSSYFFGNEINLNFLNTSQIKDMSYLFSDRSEGDIEVFDRGYNLNKGFLKSFKDRQNNLLRDHKLLLEKIENDEFLKNNRYYNALVENLTMKREEYKHKNQYDDVMIGRIDMARIKDFNGKIDFDTSSVENMEGMFERSNYNDNLTLDMSSVVNADDMFKDSNFASNFKGLNTNNLKSCKRMFYKSQVKSVEMDFENVEDMSFCFNFIKQINIETIKNCNFKTKKENVDITNFVSNSPMALGVLVKLSENKEFTKLLSNQSFFEDRFHEKEVVLLDLMFGEQAYSNPQIKNTMEFLINNFLFNEDFSKSYFIEVLNKNFIVDEVEEWGKSKLVNSILEKLLEAPNTDFVKRNKEVFKEFFIFKGLEIDKKEEVEKTFKTALRI